MRKRPIRWLHWGQAYKARDKLRLYPGLDLFSEHVQERGDAGQDIYRKPNREMAEVFVNSGEFYWNSGIFIWKLSTIREELEKYMPELASQFDGWKDVMWTDAEADFIEKAYGDSPKISIDYAVMEKTQRAWLIPAEFSWSDLGTWEALYRCTERKDEKGNLLMVKDYLVSELSDSLVLSKKKDKLVAIRGLDNFIVVDTDDVLFICPKGRSLNKADGYGSVHERFQQIQIGNKHIFL